MSMRDLSQQSGLADSPARLRSMVDRTTDVVLLLDRTGHIVYANRRLTSRYGHDQDRIVGQPMASLLHPADAVDLDGWLRGLIDAGDRATARIRLRIAGTDGVAHDVEWHGTNQLDDPLIDGIIVSGRDITDLVAMEEQVREQTEQLVHTADHDALTGLLNRRAFMDRFAERLGDRRRRADAGDAVVLFCDLDRFKAVNDTHGHEVGDQVLEAIAARLRSCVREGDLVARYGGDEFTIFLNDDASPAVVTGLIARLQSRLSEPIACGAVVADVGVTVGVNRTPLSTAQVDRMLRDADRSMYEKKSQRV
jgi:diguanylate cyclase (GGDEF)-like protein/PAS domain S-box-containing protein